MSKKFDLLAHGVAKKLGYDMVPWFILTQLVLGVYVILTILAMFFRQDFFNVRVPLKDNDLD